MKGGGHKRGSNVVVLQQMQIISSQSLGPHKSTPAVGLHLTDIALLFSLSVNFTANVDLRNLH